nr:hypothetical protein BaRGS_015395 [Batillaria attramentaria]
MVDLVKIRIPVFTDSYQDPVILKAHYRVKHVDKGIDFAGLKILRCCDHCDIVGVIKGEKKFKGAHWHCYRCRNGFNRRDEAIKHYKTHFRNPQTTFQISITQDLNNPVSYNDARSGSSQGMQSVTATSSGITTHDAIHPALTQAVTCLSSPVAVTEQDVITTGSVSNGKVSDGTVHVSIAASETGDGDEEDNTETIMIIQEEQLADNSHMDTSFPTQIIANESVDMTGDKCGTDKQQELELQVQTLQQEKAALRGEIRQLQVQLRKTQEELSASKKREAELSSRLCNATERGVQDTMKRLEQEHRNLLRQQLDVLQQVMLSSRQASSILQLTDGNGQEIQVVNAASLEAFLAGNSISTTATSEGQTTLPTTTIIHASDLPLEAASDNEVITATRNVDGSTNYVMCVKSEDGVREGGDVTIEVSSGSLLASGPVSEVEVINEAGTQDPPAKRHKVK